MLQEATPDSRVDVEVGVILEHLEKVTLAHFEVEEFANPSAVASSTCAGK